MSTPRGEGPGSPEYIDHVLQWSTRYTDTGAQITAMFTNPMCQPPNAPTGSGPIAAKIIAYARAQSGKPYIWGAQGPDAFDCSGLAMMAYRAAGVSIPRTTFEQWRQGTRVPRGQQQPGDLAFFDSGPGSSADNPGHVGIVMGHQQMINARCATCRPGITVQNYTQREDLVGFVRPSSRR